MKFLVVDDHELIREAMRGALRQLDGEAAHIRSRGQPAKPCC